MNSIAFISPAADDDNTVEIIAANVRAEIARAGMRDGEFAASFGMTAMSMSRRLSGATPFTTPEVKRVAAFFGIPIGELFTERRPRALATKMAPTANGEGQGLPGLDSNQEPIG